jgi:hypothetical protein
MSLYDQYQSDLNKGKSASPSTSPTPTPSSGGGLYAQYKAGAVAPVTPSATTTGTKSTSVNTPSRIGASAGAGIVSAVGGLIRSFQLTADRAVGDFVTQAQSAKQLGSDLETFDAQFKKISDELKTRKAQGLDTSVQRKQLLSLQKNSPLLNTQYEQTADTKSFATKAQDYTDQWSAIIKKSAGITGENQTFIEKLAEGAGSSATYFIPALGVAKLSTITARVSPTVAMIFGGSASAFLESSAESAQVYDTLKREGKSNQEAMESSTKNFLANAIILGVTERFGVFNPNVKGLLKKALLSAPVEGLQESAQQIASNINTGRPVMEGVIESGAIGAIIGGVMGPLASRVGTNPVQLKENIPGTPAPEPTPGPEMSALERQKQIESSISTSPIEQNEPVQNENALETPTVTPTESVAPTSSQGQKEGLIAPQVDIKPSRESNPTPEVDVKEEIKALNRTLEGIEDTIQKSTDAQEIAQAKQYEARIRAEIQKLEGPVEKRDVAPKEITVYRGEYKRMQKLDNAISTSLDPEVAKSFSEDGKIKAFTLSKDARIVDISDLRKRILGVKEFPDPKTLTEEQYQSITGDRLISTARELGYDVIDYTKAGLKSSGIKPGKVKDEQEYQILNPDVLTPKKADKPESIKTIKESMDKENADEKSIVSSIAELYYRKVLAPKIRNGQAVNIGADDIKDYFANDYNNAHHKYYSQATNRLFERVIKEVPADTVKFTVGGTGSGKSDFIVKRESRGFNGVIYDSTGWNVEGMKKQFEYAENLNKKIEVYGIIPDIRASRAYTFKREADGQHPVTEKAFINTHVGAIKTMLSLAREGRDVYVLDTRNIVDVEGINKAELVHNPIDVLEQVKYDEGNVKELIKDINQETFKEVIAGRQEGSRDVSPKDGADQKVETPEKKTPEQTPEEKPVLEVQAEPTQKDNIEKPTGGSSGKASIGRYRDDSPIYLGHPDRVKPIQFPELVRLSKELMDTVPFIKRYKKANGMFYGQGKGEIGLNPELFLRENIGQLQKTLAHEIGHLVDYLPDQTLTRGNLMGRLNTLRNFRKDFFGPAGASRTNTELREQMWELSKYWRPVDEATASPGYLAYRKGSDEIYADFISALFNDPRMVAEKAPTAYNVFFEQLDKKPAVRDVYFDIQSILRTGDVVKERRSAVGQMFKQTEQESKERQIQIEAEQELKEKSIFFRFKHQFVDITESVREKVSEARRRGKVLSDEDNPQYYLEERNYLSGKIRAEIDDRFNSVYQDLQRNDLTWEDLGELMFYERILKGDRKDIANPLGYQPDFIRDLLGEADEKVDISKLNVNGDEGVSSMRATLGDAKYEMLKNLAVTYRQNLKELFKQGREEGLYNSDLEKLFEENAYYVPFKGAKYSGTTRTTFGVKQQKGTLGNIENPANTGIEKAVSIIRAIERNRATRKTVDFLKSEFASDVEVAKKDSDGHPIEPKKDTGLSLVTFMRDGKVEGYYVDRYIGEALNKNTIHGNLFIDGLRFFNSGLFRPLFITFNLGFQTFNFVRDLKRFWKNVPGMTLGRAMTLYAKSARASKIRAFGLPKNPSKADLEAYELINKLEREQVLSITYNDIAKGQDLEDAQIERILREVGIRETPKTFDGPIARTLGISAQTPIVKQMLVIMDFVEKTGNLIETMPKVAGVKALEGTMAPKEMRSFVRKYVGSPDFQAGGKFKPYMNEVFLFSNAIFQGIRADYEIATQPSTRSGYWMKTTMSEIVPKALMLALAYGLFGDELKKMFENVSEYDKTNYSVVPLGYDENGKTVYVRVPSDESGRLIGGLMWKVARSMGDPEKLAELETYTNLLSYAGGQVPGFTPTLGVANSLATFIAGENPYDSFRGRNVLTDQQQQAGGTERLYPFMAWMFEQLGGGIFMKLYTQSPYPETPSLSEKVARFPLVGNVYGRFVRSSDYGQTEQLREITNQVKQDKARESLQNKRTVYKYVDMARGMSDTEAQKIKRDMIVEIYGKLPTSKEDRTQARSLEKRFDLLRLRGTVDARVDALLTATSNAEKVELLKNYKASLSPSEFNNLRDFVLSNRIVSESAWSSFINNTDIDE